MDIENRLLKALDRALAGDWDAARECVRPLYPDETAVWLDAVLCKALAQEALARKLYQSAGRDYDRFPDVRVELRAIHHEIVHERGS
jgi:hypothetical protein